MNNYNDNRKRLKYKGYLYLSLYEMWQSLGVTTLEAFRMRLSRYPRQYGYALGLEEKDTQNN